MEDEKLMGYSSDTTYLYGGSVVYPGEPGSKIPEHTTREILNEISSLRYRLKMISDRILEIESTELRVANVNEEKIERRKLIP
jgi:hypothetical protein